MKPMLDDLELPRIQEIRTHDRRALAEHKPPGMAGSLLQNLGRRPTTLLLWGIAAGPEALTFVEDLNEKFHSGEPLPFVADIVAESEIERVVIDNLHWQEVAGKPDRFVYALCLNEYQEPVSPEDASFLDSEILEDAQGLMDDLIEGLDLALAFETGLERFVDPLAEFIRRVRRFGENIEAARTS